MKYTSLFSAVAVAAAMGTSAFATVTTNNQVTVNFEGQETVVGNLTGWTAQTEDQSAIIYAPLSSADAVEGYTANKHLKLNTEGTELKWVPATYTQPKAIIEMKVRLVASDTAPAISDTDVHAAVYLKVDENAPTDDGLYAYTATGWQKLDTSGFNADLATGSMVALRVVMDYNETARTATYEGALLSDAENDDPDYVTLGTTLMANQSTALTQGKLASISFKGTGGVDDLFVGEIEETPSTASITLQQYSGGEWVDVEDGTVDTENADLAFESVVQVPSGKVAVVTVCDENGVELATLSNVIDEFGQLSVSCEDYLFEAEESYLIRVLFTDPVVNCTVTFTTDYGTAPQAETVQSGGYATNPGAPTYAGADYTFVEWRYQGVAYDFANTPVTGDITLVAYWTAASSGLPESFAIGDASQTLPQGVETIVVENGKFIVNVVEPTGATASLLGASSLTGTFTDVNATRTVKTGYTELSYTMPENETAKFFKVKFTK